MSSQESLRPAPLVAPRARAGKRPKQAPRIVSLFSGAGGLDLGFRQAGFPIAVAFDSSEAAVRSHRRNFPRTLGIVADLSALTAQKVVDRIRQVVALGERVGVIGGPPCQGFSRANTGAVPGDPRNALPAIYLAIVQSLQKHYTVEFVVFENVLGIRDRKNLPTFEALTSKLERLGFDVSSDQYCALDFGVPQMRRRVVVCGLRRDGGYTTFAPRKRRGLKTVHEAIGGMTRPMFFRRGLEPSAIPTHPNHWTMYPKSPRFSAPLPPSSDARSFKILEWDRPSPTVAFGHREIHIHPDGDRRLSIFEAMLLQGFPRTFVLEGNLSQQVEQVSNAVPPPLARSLGNALRRSLGIAP